MSGMLGTRCFAIGSLALFACSPQSENGGGDVSSEDLAATAIANVEAALRGTHRAGSFLAESQTLADSLGSLDSGSVCFEECDDAGFCSTICEEDAEPVSVDDLREARDDLDESISDFVEELRAEVLTQQNLESSDDDSATFLLPPGYFCEAYVDDYTGGAPPPEPMPDPECVDYYRRLAPRLRLTSAGEGDVDVALLLTSERANPVTLELHRARVALVADLAEIKRTLDVLGEDTEGLVSLDGKVSFQLQKNADRDYSASANVLEEVVVVVENDLAEQSRFSLGASSPTYELRLDGNARTLTGSVDLGAFRASGPLNAFSEFFASTQYDELGNPLPAPTYTGDVELVVPGLEASVTFDGAVDRLRFANLGVGDASSTLKWNGITIAQLDLNAALGRHFDLELQTQGGADPLLTFAPNFDLSVLLNFAPLANQITDISTHALNNTLHAWFEGGSPSIQAGQDQIRVVSGTFRFTSSSAPEANMTVPAGMCLVDPGDAPGNPLFEDVTVGACVTP